MISPWLVYFVMMLDNVNTFLAVITFIGIIGSIVLLFFCCVNKSCAIDSSYEETKKGYESQFELFYKWLKPAVLVSVASFLLCVFVPTTNQMAAILIIPKMANSQFSQEIQKLPVDLVKLADKYIQKQLQGDNKNA